MPPYYYVKGGETFGPCKLDNLRELSRSGIIAKDTLVCTEGAESWQSLETVLAADRLEFDHIKAAPGLAAPPASVGDVGESGLAIVFRVLGVLGLFATPIAGIGVGADGSAAIGWSVCLGGILSSLFLLGLASVLQHLYETAARLRRIEQLLRDDLQNTRGREG